MPTTITLDPVTRIEGHLKIQVTVDTVNGVQQVTDAKSSGEMFRGFELMLVGRDPLDVTQYTQRICGVCPISHGMASSMNLEKAFALTPPANGRIMRNLILGSNFVQSHILHFYHLAALDYINTNGILDMPPWFPRYVTADMVSGATASASGRPLCYCLGNAAKGTSDGRDFRRQTALLAYVCGRRLHRNANCRQDN